MDFRSINLNRTDCLIAAALGLLFFLGLAAELSAPGITWDEGQVQFGVAKNQAAWIQGLFSLDAPFSKETIDRYWYTKSDHPSPPRTVAAISYLLLSGWVDEIVALRLPSAMVFSLLLASMYLFLRMFLPRMASLAGAISLAMMPRIFGHAHLFSLDLPIMAWWFWAATAGFLAYHGKLRPIWFGLAYALAFCTKLHAVFLPAPLLAWAAIHLASGHRRERVYWMRLGKSAAWAALLAPVFYIGLQPWLWHETASRIVNRFFHYADKTPIPLYYLGTVYGESNPWHYPFVMVLFTIPALILVFLLAGLADPIAWKRRTAVSRDESTPSDSPGVYSFLLLHFIAPLLVIQLAKAYDGCRLFLTCFPFAACLVGFGYHRLWNAVPRWLNDKAIHAALMAAIVLPSLYAYAMIRPFYLAYYNEIVGGIPGAWNRGMETTFWCDALTRDFLDTINRIVPEGKTIKPASMSFEVYSYYRQRGWVRPEIADPADYFLVQSRQGMWRREEASLFFRHKPVASVELQGVQLFGLYQAGRQ